MRPLPLLAALLVFGSLPVTAQDRVVTVGHAEELLATAQESRSA